MIIARLTWVFAVASLIAIAVRGVLTISELAYVGVVTALGRRQGWSVHTGVFHASPEEEAAATRAREALMKQKQHDAFLVSTYTSVKDIEALRDVRLDELKGQRAAKRPEDLPG